MKGKMDRSVCNITLDALGAIDTGLPEKVMYLSIFEVKVILILI